MRRRYYRWIERGVLATLADDPDLDWLLIDSTVMHAHQHPAGARLAKRGHLLKAWAVPTAA